MAPGACSYPDGRGTNYGSGTTTGGRSSCWGAPMGRPDEVTQWLSKQSDADLVQVVTNEADYRPDAVAAAREELHRRHIDPPRLKELSTQAQEAQEERRAKEEEPLAWPMRTLMFILAFGIPQAIAAEHYRARGYKRKYRECWQWMGYGIAFWVVLWVLGMLSSILS
jgi:hypothetical protein